MDKETLIRAFRYDPFSGEFTRASSPKAWAVGKKTGLVASDGYVRLTVGTVRVYAHRVAWLLHYGDWPPGQLDHINGDRADNRIANLRLATPSENCRNRKKVRNGLKGVTWNRSVKKWQAQIKVHGKSHYLGLFETEEAGSAAYSDASARLHGQFGRTA